MVPVTTINVGGKRVPAFRCEVSGQAADASEKANATSPQGWYLFAFANKRIYVVTMSGTVGDFSCRNVRDASNKAIASFALSPVK